MYKCIDTIRTPETKGKDIHQTFIQQNVQKYNFMSLNILSSPKFCPIDTRKFFLRCIIHMYYHDGIVLILNITIRWVTFPFGATPLPIHALIEEVIFRPF